MAASEMPWTPSRILRVVEAFPTGTSVVRVETDQGEGFLKALGNAAGPHSLACELVGTRLAHRLGLRTLSFAVISDKAKLAWCEFICRRAGYLREIVDRHWPVRTILDSSQSEEKEP